MRSTDPSKQTVLVLCFGNLCRSPMAEGLFRNALPRDEWRVVSAGTHAIGGDAPTPGACEAMRQIAGIDISHQRSRPLTVDLLRSADHVFAMSRQQALEAAALLPDAAPRIRLLGAFAPTDGPGDGPVDPTGRPAGPDEVADPMGGAPETYVACGRRIEDCVRAAAEWLLDGAATADDGAPPATADWPKRS